MERCLCYGDDRRRGFTVPDIIIIVQQQQQQQQYGEMFVLWR